MSELPPLAVVLTEGEAKTMKTSVSGAIEATLSAEGLIVVRADAGSFFRRLTVATVEALTAMGWRTLLSKIWLLLTGRVGGGCAI